MYSSILIYDKIEIFFVMATTPYLRRWTETKQNKNKLKTKTQINKQLDYMKTIYNFKINDTVTKWKKNFFYFTWLQRLTIAQTPAWRYNYNFSDDKKKIPST